MFPRKMSCVPIARGLVAGLLPAAARAGEIPERLDCR